MRFYFSHLFLSLYSIGYRLRRLELLVSPHLLNVKERRANECIRIHVIKGFLFSIAILFLFRFTTLAGQSVRCVQSLVASQLLRPCFCSTLKRHTLLGQKFQQELFARRMTKNAEDLERDRTKKQKADIRRIFDASLILFTSFVSVVNHHFLFP